MLQQEKTTVLYVDDEPINLYLFERVFTRHNYNVLTACSGLQGLEVMKTHPDIPVVISDMRMPGMNGVEFITEAKKIFPQTVFFILTSFDLTPEIARAMEDNLVRKYIRKPFDQYEIDRFIKDALSAA